MCRICVFDLQELSVVSIKYLGKRTKMRLCFLSLLFDVVNRPLSNKSPFLLSAPLEYLKLNKGPGGIIEF